MALGTISGLTPGLHANNLALLLAMPLTWITVRFYPMQRPHLSILLAAVAVFMIATEGNRLGRIGAAIAFAASSVLGLLFLDVGSQGAASHW